MSYSVTTTRNNGYRCGCCHRSWDSTDWIEDRAEALEQVPTGYGDPELESVEVRDGATGEIIAEGSLEHAGGRAEAYSFSRWYGHVDGVKFESTEGGEPGETWAQILERIEVRRREREIAKATAEIEASQKRLAALGVTK